MQKQSQVHPSPVDKEREDSAGPEIGEVSGFNSLVSKATESLSLSEFRSFGLSNVIHSHEFSKHDVTERWGVSEEMVEAAFLTQSYVILPFDHAAVWFLHYHKQDLIDSEIPLFTNTKDTDTDVWTEIESELDAAVIGDKTQSKIQSLNPPV